MSSPGLLCAVVYEISQILNVGLDRQTVQILMALCEHGVNPEALAAVVRELRREADSIKVRGVLVLLLRLWAHTLPALCPWQQAGK